MSYYKHHVFFCINQRESGLQCCGQHNSLEIRNYAKEKTKELGLTGEGGVRISTSGCMDRCASGPVLVVYPEAIWYTYVDREDVDEIIAEHLQNGRIVERLLI